MKRVSSYKYLGDTIDFFKKDFFNSFKGIDILKISDLEKFENKRTFEEDYREFFGKNHNYIFSDKENLDDLKKLKTQHLFLDPATGLAFDKDRVGIPWGSAKALPCHIEVEHIKNILGNNKEIEYLSFYQHFPRKTMENLEKTLTDFLNEVLLKERNFEFKKCFVLKMKDFLIVTLSKSKSSKTNNQIFAYQKKLQEQNCQTRYYEFTLHNKKWK